MFDPLARKHRSALTSQLERDTLARGRRGRNPWGDLSYADLITRAILSSADGRLTLQQIYGWMVRHVPYFAARANLGGNAQWKNSIRHNLSLNDRFVRVDTGWRSAWTIEPFPAPREIGHEVEASTVNPSPVPQTAPECDGKTGACVLGLVVSDRPSSYSPVEAASFDGNKTIDFWPTPRTETRHKLESKHCRETRADVPGPVEHSSSHSPKAAMSVGNTSCYHERPSKVDLASWIFPESNDDPAVFYDNAGVEKADGVFQDFAERRCASIGLHLDVNPAEELSPDYAGPRNPCRRLLRNEKLTERHSLSFSERRFSRKQLRCDRRPAHRVALDITQQLYSQMQHSFNVDLTGRKIPYHAVQPCSCKHQPPNLSAEAENAHSSKLRNVNLVGRIEEVAEEQCALKKPTLDENSRLVHTLWQQSIQSKSQYQKPSLVTGKYLTRVNKKSGTDKDVAGKGKAAPSSTVTSSNAAQAGCSNDNDDKLCKHEEFIMDDYGEESVLGLNYSEEILGNEREIGSREAKVKRSQEVICTPEFIKEEPPDESPFETVFCDLPIIKQEMEDSYPSEGGEVLSSDWEDPLTPKQAPVLKPVLGIANPLKRSLSTQTSGGKFARIAPKGFTRSVTMAPQPPPDPYEPNDAALHRAVVGFFVSLSRIPPEKRDVTKQKILELIDAIADHDLDPDWIKIMVMRPQQKKENPRTTQLKPFSLGSSTEKSVGTDAVIPPQPPTVTAVLLPTQPNMSKGPVPIQENPPMRGQQANSSGLATQPAFFQANLPIQQRSGGSSGPAPVQAKPPAQLQLGTWTGGPEKQQTAKVQPTQPHMANTFAGIVTQHSKFVNSVAQPQLDLPIGPSGELHRPIDLQRNNAPGSILLQSLQTSTETPPKTVQSTQSLHTTPMDLLQQMENEVSSGSEAGAFADARSEIPNMDVRNRLQTSNHPQIQTAVELAQDRESSVPSYEKDAGPS